MEASMAGFGGEVLLFSALGFVVLGPKRMNAVLRHVARAKAEFDKARRDIKSQITSALDDGDEPANKGP
jgi:Sec-independent protein translocase protein TatA